ncbi:hypothetical protein BP6252_12349 [Coleophoma cylindrospora]|uniref:Cyanovirin-N domain-containing protein n=1 Tax=Coleophoma cylindrospora TaxID=1849047 RepID=A0A3D8QGJ5_9HELO|nr:hypothetical protein BP6252_12349 [Coleophoma cylindrospora]
MQFTTLLFASFATYACVAAAPAKGKAAATATSGTTIVMKEVGGIAGNECLTFRNNGEMVDAACVNTSADRQVTPSTIGGENVLLVQRTFTAGFRPDLVGVQACVGFNGTDFLAMSCNDSAFQAVSLQNNILTSGSACQSGHDSKAQLTVDTAGKTCVAVTTTNVTPSTT